MNQKTTPRSDSLIEQILAKQLVRVIPGLVTPSAHLENRETELQNFHKPTAGTIKYRNENFRDNAKIRLEQINDAAF